MARLAEVIRKGRAGRYSLEDLAERSGVSSGLLSQIERGLGNPSFITLSHIARALDLPLAAFFTGPNPESSILVRKSERKKLRVPHNDVSYELLTPNLQSRLGMLLAHIPAGFDSSDRPASHDGEDSYLIMKGRLELTVGDQGFMLFEGDSITFDATLVHIWRNPLKRQVDVLIASTPPLFSI
jgi:transcriptional regulator with XRE-family HTH domain